MRVTWLLLLACAHVPPEPGPVGRESRPYTTLPEYFQHPLAARDVDPPVPRLLRVIDTQASTLEGSPNEAAELTVTIHELADVVPAKPELLLPVERMKQVVADMPKQTPEKTRRRLQALTDLIRLRGYF